VPFVGLAEAFVLYGLSRGDESAFDGVRFLSRHGADPAALRLRDTRPDHYSGESSSAASFVYIELSEMYNWNMSTISVADARNHFADVIAHAKGEAVFIERRGKRAAVVISPEQYERMLEALEDAEDAEAFDEAMAEEGRNIPWAQVKADLGWG